jgi:hypothetical protein
LVLQTLSVTLTKVLQNQPWSQSYNRELQRHK